MLAAVSLFLLAGYSPVYAAVANGGALARNPWLALTQDAYAVGGGDASTSTPSTWDQIFGWGSKIAGWITNPVGTIQGWLP